jgi:serine/threonine protein kinase
VAAAMAHLHGESMLHGDLKASNVLLVRSGGADAAVPSKAEAQQQPQQQQQQQQQQLSQQHRYVAKVSDFGLARHLEAGATHASCAHGGTLTHMAPELLLDGRASKASDVYAVRLFARCAPCLPFVLPLPCLLSPF